jgi:hypothetical protein
LQYLLKIEEEKTNSRRKKEKKKKKKTCLPAHKNFSYVKGHQLYMALW